MTIPDPRSQRPSRIQKEGPYVEKRSEYQRDVDRVMYDYYFRRLGQITQVSSGAGRVLLHNRMTHSLKVAQVGRRLVQYLQIDDKNQKGIAKAGGIDPDVVDAAGLLHDIGHPPFGHVAEAELDKIAQDNGLTDGFEGNAQTFHIIVSLTTHHWRGKEDGAKQKPIPMPGLDLTRAVTAACMKYPWDAATATKTGPKRRKWGVYDCDKEAFEFVEPLLRDGGPNLEAEIMDWADDITYAVHDLQDFYTDGVLPLHRLRHDHGKAAYEREMNDFWDYAMRNLLRRGEEILPRGVFAEFAQRFPDHAYQGTNEDRAETSSLASRVISDASRDTSVRPSGHLSVEKDTRFVINVLKQITWYYVIDKPELVSVQIGQRRKIREVFDGLFGWAWRADGTGSEPPAEGPDGAAGEAGDEEWLKLRRLPVDLGRYYTLLQKADEHEHAYGDPRLNMVRATIDYIASMTEAELDDMHIRLTSGGHVSSLASHRLD